MEIHFIDIGYNLIHIYLFPSRAAVIRREGAQQTNIAAAKTSPAADRDAARLLSHQSRATRFQYAQYGKLENVKIAILNSTKLFDVCFMGL